MMTTQRSNVQVNKPPILANKLDYYTSCDLLIAVIIKGQKAIGMKLTMYVTEGAFRSEVLC